MHQSHILVVDDEEAIRITLDALLRRCGYSVTLAASGEQALVYIAAHPFELVLLDVILPGISGLDVAKFVRALHPATAILMLTGSVFAPYYRATNVPPTIAGSGLGLASVYQLVTAEGGTVAVRSGVDAGACFTIRLPLCGTVVQPVSEAI